MVNLSMAPLFVSSCGVQLWEDRKAKLTMPISVKPFVLRPGQSKTVTGKYFNELINDKALLHDRVRIYVVCQMDKVYYEKKDIFMMNLSMNLKKLINGPTKLIKIWQCN